MWCLFSLDEPGKDAGKGLKSSKRHPELDDGPGFVFHDYNISTTTSKPQCNRWKQVLKRKLAQCSHSQHAHDKLPEERGSDPLDAVHREDSRPGQ